MRTEVLDGLFEALRSRGVRWCLLRPASSLERAEGDIDLLAAPGDMRAASEVLRERGFVSMPVPGPDVHASLYDEGSGRFMWIHLQGALRIAGQEIAAEEVLGEASPGEPPLPADDWLLWILLLRALVEKGELSERHRADVQSLAGRWDGGPARLVAMAHARGLDPAQVVELAAAGDWAALAAHTVPPEPAPGPGRLARAVARIRALRELPERRGMSVAVIGPDGAGKTSLIRGLSENLPLPTVVQYMGLTGGRLPRADRLRVPGLVLGARIAILWLRWARSAMHRARGRIVLFDRYTLDGSVPSGMTLTPAGRLSRRVQRRVCPLPDLVLVLDASGETLHTRSGEYDPEVLELWRRAYARLEADVPALAVIDAEQPAETVRHQAQALIWGRFAELRPR